MLCQNYLCMISTKSQRRLKSKQTCFVTSSWSRFPTLLMLYMIHPNNHASGLRFAVPDSKVHGANMGPTWVLSAPDGPHVGTMNRAIWDVFQTPLLNPQHQVHIRWIRSFTWNGLVCLSKALTVCNPLPYNTTMYLYLTSIIDTIYIYIYIYICNIG